MQQLLFRLSLIAIVALSACKSGKQPVTATAQPAPTAAIQTATEGGYTYEFVPGDPLKTRIYTLKNGLKVYLSRYTEAPRIYTCIAVNAGGRNDPAETTGLAHYLEHLMFKGTTKLGTQAWGKERVYIDSVEHMFEHYRTLTNPEERAAYYGLIDKVSNEASQFAIANEYDKATASIGAKGTNAYTSQDQTVYINDIPSNEFKRWLEMERERFSVIVPRLFHTELEAVYEEKNRALDNDNRKVYELMYQVLFNKHPYGSQTVLGTVEHLKNPSITNIKAYFDKYYVPNNMAICLSGDLEYDAAIRVIDQTFGTMPTGPIAPLALPKAEPLTANVEKTVYGPSSESVSLGFAFGGSTSRDALMISIVDMLLSNNNAGLIDLNLNQEQKVLQAGSRADINADYSAHTFYGAPREGQSLEEVRDLLLAQIQLVAQGKFDQWLLDAVITDLRVQRLNQYETNESRASALVDAFGMGKKWADYVSEIDRMDAVAKQEIVDFVKSHYQHYVVVYKRTGEDKALEKITKPVITKVALNRDKQSEYLAAFMAQQPARLTPQFLNYEADIRIGTMKSNVPVWAVANADNDLFELTYLFEAGNNADPRLKIAANYLSYLGTDNLDAAAFSQELYKLGCKFDVNTGDERTYVLLSGLNANMEKAITLFENLLAQAKPDNDALADMVAGMRKQRTNAKKSKGVILNQGFENYGRYGKRSPFTNVLSDAALDSLTGKQLTDIIHGLAGMEHRVLYYGPRTLADVLTILNAQHNVPATLKAIPTTEFAEQGEAKTKVYWVNYDMVQAEILMLSKGLPYDPSRVPTLRLYNDYFGGGMNAIVFQELREAQGLAYSVNATYSQGAKVGRSDYMRAYIGTQADKLAESLAGMRKLLEEMPESQSAFKTAREAVLSRIESERITKSDKLFAYATALRLGLDHDIRSDVYSQVQVMTFADVQKFQQQYVKGKPYAIFVLGAKDRLDFEVLRQYGEVQELTLEDIFGY